LTPHTSILIATGTGLNCEAVPELATPEFT
jgi:hypothetical protein